MEIKCGSCGAANDADAKFCAGCGKVMQAICPHCGSPASGKFCGKCGAPVEEAAEVNAQGSSLPGIFAVFEGALSEHNVRWKMGDVALDLYDYFEEDGTIAALFKIQGVPDIGATFKVDGNRLRLNYIFDEEDVTARVKQRLSGLATLQYKNGRLYAETEDRYFEKHPLE